MVFLPNMLTLFNLFFGIISLMYAFDNEVILAAVFILLAGVMDVLDGKAARKLNVSSDFGKELDSLSDLVSFGVAPAFLVMVLFRTSAISETLSFMIAASGIIFIICGAFRLARFNVLDVSEFFVGVPITLAGGIISLMVLTLSAINGWCYVVVLLVLSGLMVSKKSIPKLSRFTFHKAKIKG